MKIIDECLYYDMADNTSRTDFRDYVKNQIKKVGAKWRWKEKCWKLPPKVVSPLQELIDEYEKQFLDLDSYTEEDMLEDLPWLK